MSLIADTTIRANRLNSLITTSPFISNLSVPASPIGDVTLGVISSYIQQQQQQQQVEQSSQPQSPIVGENRNSKRIRFQIRASEWLATSSERITAQLNPAINNIPSRRWKSSTLASIRRTKLGRGSSGSGTLTIFSRFPSLGGSGRSNSNKDDDDELSVQKAPPRAPTRFQYKSIPWTKKAKATLASSMDRLDSCKTANTDQSTETTIETITAEGEAASSAIITPPRLVRNETDSSAIAIPPPPLPSPIQRKDTESSVKSSTREYKRSSTMDMLTKYSCMSYRFPVTSKTEKVVLRKNAFGKKRRRKDMVIETTSGKVIGSIEHSRLRDERNIRIIKDATGKNCAIIQKVRDDTILGPTCAFRIYGDKPSTYGQKRCREHYSVVNGCYLWAEIKNRDAIKGGKFVMKRYSTYSGRCTQDPCIAKRFGSLFSNVSSTATAATASASSNKRSSTFKGYAFLDGDEKEIVKMANVDKHGSKGIVIAPNRDMCLMLAYCAAVDEMVENLLI